MSTLMLAGFMRGKKILEGRAFDENDHAIFGASTLSVPNPRDGRRAKQKLQRVSAG